MKWNFDSRHLAGAVTCAVLAQLTVPCAMAGGSCRAASDCSRGVGSIGSDKYSCGGSRRVCCFDACGAEAESVECCNADHSYAPRPTCTDGKLSCAAGATKVPIGTCIPKG